MDVADELNKLRSELTHCSLLAFADLSSQLVLCTSTDAKPAQEELSALSTSAEVTLNGSVAEAASPVWNGDEKAPAETAILMTEKDVRIFLRTAEKPKEALIAVCAPDVSIPTVVEASRATLARIAAQGE